MPQMPVPGIGHEAVGADEQQNGDKRDGKIQKHGMTSGNAEFAAHHAPTRKNFKFGGSGRLRQDFRRQAHPRKPRRSESCRRGIGPQTSGVRASSGRNIAGFPKRPRRDTHTREAGRGVRACVAAPPGLFSRSSAGRLPAPGICRRNRFRNVLRLKIPAGQAPCPARRFHAAAIAWRRRRIAANRRGAARSGRGEQGAASLRLTPQSISTTEYSGESTPLRAMKRHGARTRR